MVATAPNRLQYIRDDLFYATTTVTTLGELKVMLEWHNNTISPSSFVAIRTASEHCSLIFKNIQTLVEKKWKDISDATTALASKSQISLLGREMGDA